MDIFSKKAITSLNLYGILSLSKEQSIDVKNILAALPTKKLLNTIIFKSDKSYFVLDVSKLSDIEFITWKTGRSDLVLKFIRAFDSHNRLYLHNVTGISPETVKPILERLGRYDIILRIS